MVTHRPQVNNSPDINSADIANRRLIIIGMKKSVIECRLLSAKGSN